MGSGGKNAVPTALRLIRGNPSGRPINQREAKPLQGIPDPPPELSPDARVEWDRMSVQLYRVGLLTMLDRAALTAYCVAWGRWALAERRLAEMQAAGKSAMLLPKRRRGRPRKDDPAQRMMYEHELVAVADRAAKDMVKYAGEFGMSPSSRSRIQVLEPVDGEDPASKYLS